jgi:hypothetical protein
MLVYAFCLGLPIHHFDIYILFNFYRCVIFLLIISISSVQKKHMHVKSKNSKLHLGPL